MAGINRPESRPAAITPSRAAADRLVVCQGIGIAVLAATLLAAVGVCGDALLRDDARYDPRVELVRRFGLDQPALVPTGRTWRLAPAPQASADWHYGPRLAGIAADSADLVFVPPTPPERDAALRRGTMNRSKRNITASNVLYPPDGR